MKKISYFAAAAALAFIGTGCSNENLAPETQIGAEVSFNAEYSDPAETRIAVADDGKATWVASDECGLLVGDNQTDNFKFTTTEQDVKGKTAVFKGQMDPVSANTPVLAYYPHNGNAKLVGPRTVQFSIAEQIQREVGSTMLLAATGKMSGTEFNGAMKFEQKSAGLAFNIYGSLKEAGSLKEHLQSVKVTFDAPVPATVNISADGQVTFTEEVAEYVLKFQNTPELKYAKAGINAILSIPYGQDIKVKAVTVDTDQAVYTKTFEAAKTISQPAGHIKPVALDVKTMSVSFKHSMNIKGAHNSWGECNADQQLYGRVSTYYTGNFTFAGEFKFEKDNVWYGEAGNNGDDFRHYLYKNGGGNLNAKLKPEDSAHPLDGKFFVIANLDDGGNSEMLLIKDGTLRLVGDVNGWNEKDTSENLEFKYNAANRMWELKGIALPEGGFKLLYNTYDWTHNFGFGDGEVENTPLEAGQAYQFFEGRKNAKVSAGTYDIYVDFSIPSQRFGGTIAWERIGE